MVVVDGEEVVVVVDGTEEVDVEAGARAVVDVVDDEVPASSSEAGAIVVGDGVVVDEEPFVTTAESSTRPLSTSNVRIWRSTSLTSA